MWSTFSLFAQYINMQKNLRMILLLFVNCMLQITSVKFEINVKKYNL